MRKARIAQVALRRNMRQELWDDGSPEVNARDYCNYSQQASSGNVLTLVALRPHGCVY